MSKTILINDETPCGKILNQVMLTLEKDCITLNELLKERIEQEINDSNANKHTKAKAIFHKQTESAYIALHAFRENGFFVLINNQAVRDLNQLIPIRNDLRVRFIQMHPQVV